MCVHKISNAVSRALASISCVEIGQKDTVVSTYRDLTLIRYDGTTLLLQDLSLRLTYHSARQCTTSIASLRNGEQERARDLTLISCERDQVKGENGMMYDPPLMNLITPGHSSSEQQFT